MDKQYGQPAYCEGRGNTNDCTCMERGDIVTWHRPFGKGTVLIISGETPKQWLCDIVNAGTSTQQIYNIRFWKKNNRKVGSPEPMLGSFIKALKDIKE